MVSQQHAFRTGEKLVVLPGADGFPAGTKVKILRGVDDEDGAVRTYYWWYVGDLDSDQSRYVRPEHLDYLKEDSDMKPDPNQLHTVDAVEIGQIDPGPDQRKAAFEWAVEQIPEDDVAAIVKLADWLLTGEWKA